MAIWYVLLHCIILHNGMESIKLLTNTPTLYILLIWGKPIRSTQQHVSALLDHIQG
jgi:hypothetical protein